MSEEKEDQLIVIEKCNKFFEDHNWHGENCNTCKKFAKQLANDLKGR